MIKTSQKSIIEVSDWDKLVSETYGRTYSFQQQDGCKSRGIEYLTVPCEYAEDYENESLPERVNGEEMGVTFEAWLARDPKKWGNSNAPSYDIELFWERNFYPSVEMIANDLHAKGLLPAGEYGINIDW